MSRPTRTIIGVRTALLLYTALLGIAWWTLQGKFFSLAVIIVLAAAAKTYVDHLRRRL